ncbi:hypothetical protein [Streptomyces lasiicapitis]|uniref:hypothetical protein n=1 Tax=Streptomyces lasiicapitis TaxID=1923961 RepID=UPI0036948F9A
MTPPDDVRGLRGLLGLTGDPQPGGRTAAVANVTAAVVSVLAAAVVVRLLPVPGWLGPALGGGVAVLALQGRWGSRLWSGLGRRRDSAP